MMTGKVVMVHAITQTGFWRDLVPAETRRSNVADAAYSHKCYVVVRDVVTGRISALDGRGVRPWTGWRRFDNVDAAILAGRITA